MSEIEKSYGGSFDDYKAKVSELAKVIDNQNKVLNKGSKKKDEEEDD